MVISIIGIIIGLAVAVFSLISLKKEKDDKESVKIYATISVIGAIVFAVSLVKLIMTLI